MSSSSRISHQTRIEGKVWESLVKACSLFKTANPCIAAKTEAGEEKWVRDWRERVWRRNKVRKEQCKATIFKSYFNEETLVSRFLGQSVRRFEYSLMITIWNSKESHECCKAKWELLLLHYQFKQRLQQGLHFWLQCALFWQLPEPTEPINDVSPFDSDNWNGNFQNIKDKKVRNKGNKEEWLDREKEKGRNAQRYGKWVYQERTKRSRP